MHAGMQAPKLASRRTNGKTERLIDRHTDRQACRHASRQTAIQTGRQASRQAGMQTCKQAGKQVSRQTDGKNRQTGRLTEGQMNKWTFGRMDRSLRESRLYGVETSPGTTHPLIIGENGKKFSFVFC